MKKLTTATITIAVFLLICTQVFAADSMYNFVGGYGKAEFGDVNESDWFYDGVVFCARYGIIDGVDDGSFDPGANINMEQAVVIAARLHNVYHNNGMEVKDSNSDKQKYFDYSIEKGIIKKGEFEKRDILTRQRFADLITRVFPEYEFGAVNKITSIPDFDIETDLGRRVLMLYNAGIISGTDRDGCFSPELPVNKAEASVIILRVIRPDKRIIEPDNVKATYISDFSKEAALPARKKLVLSEGGRIEEFTDGYIIVYDSVGNRTRVIGPDGNAVIDWIQGIINWDGEMFQVRDKNNGLDNYYVKGNGEMTNGELYPRAYDFYKGQAPVQKQDGTICIIDTTGKTLKSFDSHGYLLGGRGMGHMENYLRLYSGSDEDIGYSVFLNPEDGSIIGEEDGTDYIYYYDSATVDGIAAVKRDLGLVRFPDSRGTYEAVWEYNLMNQRGEYILPKGYKGEVELYESGYAVVSNYYHGEYRNENDSSVFGIVDIKGNVVAPLKYENIGKINNKDYAIFNDRGDKSLRSLNGEVILQLDSQYDYELYDDFILVKGDNLKKAWGEEYAFMNFKGDIIIPFFTVHNRSLKIDGNNYLYKYKDNYYIVEIPVA